MATMVDCARCGNPLDLEDPQPCETGGLCGRNPEHGPRCGECRLGLGTHNVLDPLCELGESGQHRVWLAGIDRLVDRGVDPFLAIVDADPR